MRILMMVGREKRSGKVEGKIGRENMMKNVEANRIDVHFTFVKFELITIAFHALKVFPRI